MHRLRVDLMGGRLALRPSLDPRPYDRLPRSGLVGGVITVAADCRGDVAQDIIELHVPRGQTGSSIMPRLARRLGGEGVQGKSKDLGHRCPVPVVRLHPRRGWG